MAAYWRPRLLGNRRRRAYEARHTLRTWLFTNPCGSLRHLAFEPPDQVGSTRFPWIARRRYWLQLRRCFVRVHDSP